MNVFLVLLTELIFKFSTVVTGETNTPLESPILNPLVFYRAAHGEVGTVVAVLHHLFEQKFGKQLKVKVLLFYGVRPMNT